jgi:hypothetical protein
MDVAGSYKIIHDATSQKTVGLIFRIRTVRKEYYDLHENSVAAAI